jgi:hypothetical protein
MDLGIIELGINPPEKVLVTAICPFQIIFDRNLFQSTRWVYIVGLAFILAGAAFISPNR